MYKKYHEHACKLAIQVSLNAKIKPILYCNLKVKISGIIFSVKDGSLICPQWAIVLKISPLTVTINPLNVKGSHIWDLAIVSQFWLTSAS